MLPIANFQARIIIPKCKSCILPFWELLYRSDRYCACQYSVHTQSAEVWLANSQSPVSMGCYDLRGFRGTGLLLELTFNSQISTQGSIFISHHMGQSIGYVKIHFFGGDFGTLSIKF